MKKLTVLLAAIGMMGVAANANAGDGGVMDGSEADFNAWAFHNTNYVGDDPDAAEMRVDDVHTCDALLRTEVVTVNLSNNVSGHVFCDTSPVSIGVATAHASGRQNPDDTFNYYYASSRGGRVAAFTADDQATLENLSTLASDGELEGEDQ